MARAAVDIIDVVHNECWLGGADTTNAASGDDEASFSVLSTPNAF